MKIVPLLEHVEYLDAVVEALWNEWGKYKNLTRAYWECWVRSSLHPTTVPQTYIALSEPADGDICENVLSVTSSPVDANVTSEVVRPKETVGGVWSEQLLGTVSLWRNDLQSRQDLTPWLGGLYVVPAFRGRGVARALQQYVLRRAAAMSIPRIYLMTEHIDFYERMGWIFMETSPHETGVDVRIYSHDIANAMDDA